MLGPMLQKRGLVTPGGPGLACDSEGLALGSIILAERDCRSPNGRQYRLRPVNEVAKALFAAYGPTPTSTVELWCRRIRKAVEFLNSGDVVLAGIEAVLIGLPEISPDGMAKLSCSTLLCKYNPDWEDEPRVPAGNPEGGEWATGDGAGGPNNQTPVSEIDVAYNGTHHDQVVATLVAHWRSQGAKVVTGLRLTTRSGVTARADAVALDPASGDLLLFEIKTGNDPQYTDPQRLVYPMAQIGDHVYSPDTKIRALGFTAGERLPAMRFYTIYKYDESSPYEWRRHGSPIVP